MLICFFFSDKGGYTALEDTSNFLALFKGDTHLIFMKASGNSGEISRANLETKSVAVIRGVVEEAQKLKEFGMEIVEVDTPEQSLKMLKLGRIDYSNMSMLPIKYQIREAKDRSLLTKKC